MYRRLNQIIKESIQEALHDFTDLDRQYEELLKQYFASEEFRKQQTLHNADYETKRQEMGGYLDNRARNLGKKLGNMTKSEWDSLHLTSESFDR